MTDIILSCKYHLNIPTYYYFLDAPNTSTFFTYCYAGQVYINFTDTTTSRKKFDYNSFRNCKKLNGENISTHFPERKFILGIHNGGKINRLKEDFAYRYVKEGNLDKVKEYFAVNGTEKLTWNL